MSLPKFSGEPSLYSQRPAGTQDAATGPGLLGMHFSNPFGGRCRKPRGLKITGSFCSDRKGSIFFKVLSPTCFPKKTKMLHKIELGDVWVILKLCALHTAQWG